MEMLLNHAWPGNLRELYHTMRSVTLFCFCDDKVVRPEHVAFHRNLSAERPQNGAERPAERAKLPINSLLTSSSVSTSAEFTKCPIATSARLHGSSGFPEANFRGICVAWLQTRTTHAISERPALFQSHEDH
jgi:DNA-binding NtrC family response regulator